MAPHIGERPPAAITGVGYDRPASVCRRPTRPGSARWAGEARLFGFGAGLSYAGQVVVL